MADPKLSKRVVNFLSAVAGRSSQERKHILPKIKRKGGRVSSNATPSLFATGDGGVGDQLEVNQALITRFIDYEHMDQYPECSAVLDIYSDDSTQPDSSSGHTLEVETEDEQLKEALEELLYHRLDMEGEIWEIARSLVKYGNNFEEVLIDPGRGVVGLEYISAPSIRRVETREHGLMGFIQDRQGHFEVSPAEFQAILDGKRDVPHNEMALLRPFQCVHFRLRSVYRQSKYGFSVLEPGRWIWKRLVLLEDAVLVHKLSRAPSRYAFYVDVGKRNAREAMKYLNRVKQKFKKKKFVNKDGRLDLKFNPLGFDEDFFIPVIDGQDSARIDVLSGPDFQGMEEANYFRNKLYAGLKVPSSRLNWGDQRGETSSALSNEDVQFARSVLRIQRELRNGVKKICKIHLSALEVDPSQNYFEIYMTIPSGIYEVAQMEIRNARADLAARMREFVSLEWTLSEIFGFSAQEIQGIKAQRAAEQSAAEGGMGMESVWKDGITPVLQSQHGRHSRMSRKDMRRMNGSAKKALMEDDQLRGRIQEIHTMLRDMQSLRPGALGGVPRMGRSNGMSGIR